MMDSDGRETVVTRVTPICADRRLPGQREASLLFRTFLFLATTWWTVKGSRLAEPLWFNEDGGSLRTFTITAASRALLQGGWEGGRRQWQAGRRP